MAGACRRAVCRASIPLEKGAVLESKVRSRTVQNDERTIGRSVIVLALAVALGLPVVHTAACHVVMRFFPGLILFYTGLGLLGIITLGLVVIAARAVRCDSQSKFFLAVLSIASTVLASAGCTLAFFVVVPVTLDRSISTFLLSRIDAARAEDGLSESDLRRAFERDYVDRNAAIARRLSEQLASGTIRRNDAQRYELTGRGDTFLRVARMVSRLYGVSPTYVSAAEDGSEPRGE